MSRARALLVLLLVALAAAAQGTDGCPRLSLEVEREHCTRTRAPAEGRADLCLSLTDAAWRDECLAEAAPVVARTSAQEAIGICRQASSEAWRAWCRVDIATVIARRDAALAREVCSPLPLLLPWGACMLGALSPYRTAVLILALALAAAAVAWRRRAAWRALGKAGPPSDAAGYVKECRAKGFSDEEIVGAMNEYGYAPDEIEDALGALAGGEQRGNHL